MSIAGAIQQQQSRRQSPAPTTDWRSRALELGRAEIGKPYSGPVIGEPESYRWGDPGWDCSSFVSGMISGATDGAVKLTAYTDAAYDQLAPTNDPLPGDVVFYRYVDSSQPGVRFPHMGLWLSDTMVLDARYPQGVGEHLHVNGAAREVRTLKTTQPSSVWIPPEQDTDYRGFLYREAPRRGMDPDVCAKVISHEGGLSEPARLGDFSGPPWYSGKSWWMLQLHYGDDGTYDDWGGSAGMGNSFTAFTGWAPGDPRAWRDAARYGLDGARANGWYAWYGAAAEGIRGFMGIDRNVPWSGTPADEWDFKHR